MAELDKDIDVMEIKVWNIHFDVPLTYDEANALINNRKGKVARELKRYILKVFKTGAEKVLDAMNNDKPEVKKCKVKGANLFKFEVIGVYKNYG